MEKRRQTRSQGSAAVACKSCRRLKMRCVGADQPPCARCQKAGRDCIVPDRVEPGAEASTRTSPTQGAHFDISPPSDATEMGGHPPRVDNSQYHNPSLTPALTNQPAIPNETWQFDCRTQYPSPYQLPMTKLPSIYSTSPLQLLTLPGLGSKTSPAHTASCSTASQITPSETVASPNRIADIEDLELVHLAEFFIAKMSFILPILREPDLVNIPELLQNQRPLVYCMAFVASRFVPGRSAQRNKSIQRNQLIPHILGVIQMRSDIGKYSEEQQWMVMQSLAILYTWASPLGLERISDDDTINTQLSHAELKSAVETTALSISLHRSAEDVMKILQAGGHVLNSLSLHKYLYWLWLYSSAHRYSLLTSTPPTLREDTSIKLAPRILESLLEDHLVGRILAEIDLCLLWSQAALHQYSLGEWWSSLVIGDIDLSTLAVLEDLDGALDIWRQRWCPTNDSGSYARSGFIAFNYRFARLCISTYSVRLLREVSTEVPYSIQLEITMKSIQAASHFCAFITELPPLAIDYLRYLADTAFLKIVYGCEYILRGCEILLHNENTTKFLDTVADVAQLMSQIAIDANHAPKVYGDRILEKVEHIRERLQNSQSDSRGGSSQDSADWASTSTFPGESDLVKALTFNAASIFPF